MTTSTTLKWAEHPNSITDLGLKAYGVSVGIRVNGPDILERLVEHLPPGWRPCPSKVVDRRYFLSIGAAGNGSQASRVHLLFRDGVQVARSQDLDLILEILESDLQISVAEAAPRVFIHAGVVGWRGKAILIPGRSFSGKTTLVAELVRAGADYYSDEYAVVDRRGRVHPYPKPLSIREGADNRQKKYPVEALGGRPGVRPLPLGLVVVTRYEPGAEWRPESLSAGQGILELLANTVSARREPERALDTFKNFFRGVHFLKSARGEAKEVAPFILEEAGQLSQQGRFLTETLAG